MPIVLTEPQTAFLLSQAPVRFVFGTEKSGKTTGLAYDLLTQATRVSATFLSLATTTNAGTDMIRMFRGMAMAARLYLREHLKPRTMWLRNGSQIHFRDVRAYKQAWKAGTMRPAGIVMDAADTLNFADGFWEMIVGSWVVATFKQDKAPKAWVEQFPKAELFKFTKAGVSPLPERFWSDAGLPLPAG